MASVRSWKKPPLCLTEIVPAGSKIVPLLAKAEPISSCGSASVIIFKKRKETCITAF